MLSFRILRVVKLAQEIYDLPQAKKIYNLAIKRMPKGYKRPSSPSKVVGIEKTISPKKTFEKYKSKRKLSKNQLSEKR